uniref:Adenomatous polyposis coli protein n=2 Tax=Photinus pyralis TaxID=7054 RepID=A0A1Y1N4K9_PHOPY
MSLPVSQYEALLQEVRGLRHKAQKVQQLATPLLTCSSQTPVKDGPPTSFAPYSLNYKMESLIERQKHPIKYDRIGSIQDSEDECGGVSSAQLSVSSEPISHEGRGMSVLYHGTWPVEKTMWNSEPTNLAPSADCNRTEMTSVMSFASSSGGAPLDRVLSSPDRSRRSSQQLEAKVDMVYSLLSILGGQEHADMGETLLALSTSPESCLAMRQSGCIPLLVQLVQSDRDADTRKKASLALHNLIYSNSDEKLRKRETRVLKLLEQIRTYTAYMHNQTDIDLEILTISEDGDKHPVQTIAHLMKLSFDEGHRQAICQLGGIHSIANLIETEHALHGSTSEEGHCVLLRRYSCMALTNLTFGDSGNKALLCSFRQFMRVLVLQLQSPCDELRQVTASVLRNLSWRADSTSKEILKEVGAVTGLMKAAMINNKENTLKSILSALWNLSAHCPESKSEICSIDGALGFLVTMLSYKSPTKSLAIIENAGGILRNVSSQIAVRDDYRELLRNHDCLRVLLDQLKSPSLTIVSNACGTLWNLSAKNQTDQETLWKMGAPTMLRSLNHSKHKMIAMGSSAALKNLLASRPTHNLLPSMDATAKAMDLPVLPTLGARKQKALFQELEQNLTETFESTDKESPTKTGQEEQFLLETANAVLTVSNNGDINKTYKRKSLQNDSHDSSLIEAFKNLTIDEPSTSFSNRSRVLQDYGSSSLPYIKPPLSYSSPLHKYSDLSYKEEQYSQNSQVLDDENFGIYTETDLDQPTDYSLRYAEDDSEPDDMCNKKAEGTDFVQDTVKTYCTEDTPYETPFNYSTATSMSDLRETGLETEKSIIDNDKLVKSNLNSIKNASMSQSDEKDHCSVEDVSEIDNAPKVITKNLKSQFSSGLASPEKPVNYADEGTPGYFSRVSSFSSLNSMQVGDKVKYELDNKEVDTRQEVHDDTVPQKSEVHPEGKAVKFEQVVNYAEETPLMFSRSSSLASLDSIEQHSIHDDRESVISDFSRLTSGIVSPSELPDSPTQTVPPSPRQPLPSAPRTVPLTHRTPADGSPQIKPQPKIVSAFEDNVKKFKEESTPIQFSTATSLSSLTIDDHEDGSDVVGKILTISKRGEVVKKSKEDEIPAVSESEEDEDILAACISDGMQNNRHHLSGSQQNIPSPLFNYSSKSMICTQGSGIPLPHARSTTTSTNDSSILKDNPSSLHSNSFHNYCTEDINYTGDNSNISLLSTASDIQKKDKVYSSDDSSNLSGDNENILAECIQSAMPKTRRMTKPIATTRPLSALPVRNVQTSTPIKPFTRIEHPNSTRLEELKRPSPSVYLSAKDEVENYAVENSPCQFSLHSSLSDLTVDGSVAGGFRPNQSVHQPTEVKDTKPTAGPSSLNTEQIAATYVPEFTLSRQESFSSLSADSFGSLEQEQALLEQCISSGMPKSKHTHAPKTVDAPRQVIVTKPIGVATKQFNANKTQSDSIRPMTYDDKSIRHGERKTDFADQDEKLVYSKNVNVTSAVGSTIAEKNVMRPTTPSTAADVAHIEKSEEKVTRNRTIIEIQADISRDKCLPFEENLSIEPMRSGCETLVADSDVSPESLCSITDNIEFDFGNVNLEIKAVDTRMLDPDAMIESLDRFTAELVSQAEAAHSNKDAHKFTTSITDGDTWNDDSSPNDLTFPSISGSAPNVITFHSESDCANTGGLQEDVIFHLNGNGLDAVDGVNDSEQKSSDFSSINTSTMTESTLIAVEATKMANAFKNEAELSQSITSVQSLELDCIQPPSHMNSLTSSMNGLDHHLTKGSPKLVNRKKLLHNGLIARRALTNSFNQNSSLESLDNQSLSNLDHMHPPSTMGEVLDILDLESSMTSVASLTSEAVDVKLEQPNPIFNVKQPANMLHLFSNTSLTDLENVNPPSLLNEITDMCNSLADVATENICSETEPFEDCNTHMNDTDDVTLFSDAQSVTPIQSDLGSSAETSPKKTRTLTKRMTPKQKRKLVQERYRTYTVAAEMVISAELGSLSDNCNSEYQTVPEFSQTESHKKLSPKEKRLNDRARYQTQVLSDAVTAELQKMCDKSDVPLTPVDSPQASPGRSKLSIRRNFIQKRLENQDRFKTRTLSESSLSPDISSASPPTNDLQSLVQKEAGRVLRKLHEAHLHSDNLLDCETLSLISNDEDSDFNSGSPINYRTYTKNCTTQNTVAVNNVSVESSPTVQLQVVEAEIASGDDESKVKPKIIKPDEKVVTEDANEEVKGIRGRRKALYSKTNVANTRISTRNTNIRPIRTITSNLVKNVTSVIKSGTNLKGVASKQETVGIPKAPATQAKSLKPPSGYHTSKVGGGLGRAVNGPQAGLGTAPKHKSETKKLTPPPPLERQGTFTKDEEIIQPTKSRIPTPASNLPKPKPASRIARAISQTNSTVGKTVSRVQNALTSRPVKSTAIKSVSSDRATNSRPTLTGNSTRSSSADSRDAHMRRQNIQNSSSSQSLKSESGKKQNGAVSRSSPSTVSQRSSSNSSITSNGSSSKKQVTSKIASLWKKVEEQKKQVPKKDTRVWIQRDREEVPQMIRSNTFESKDGVSLRSMEGHDKTVPDMSETADLSF